MKRGQRLGLFAGLLVFVAVGFAIAGRTKASGTPVMTVTTGMFERHVTAEGTLQAEKATLISTPNETQGPMKIGWIADDQSAVKKDDVLVRFDPTDYVNELRGGTTERSKADNRILKHGAETDATRKNLQRDATQAELELEAAKVMRVTDDEIFSRFERIEGDIDESLANERRGYAYDVQAIRGALSRADRDIIAIDRKKADMRIGRAEKGLRALTVTAPHDGILVLQRDWRGDLAKVGSTVFSGRPIAEIPELGVMKAEVYVLEADAGGVAEGQKAEVRVDSAPGVVYAATVSRVDKVAKPRTRGVPVQYFGVTLKLARTDITVMKPGARVRATIELATLPNSIAIPRQALFEKKGDKIVYAQRGKTFVPARVTVGLSSAGKVIITSGLKAGDVIALKNPVEETDNRGARSEASG
ncbi:MAG TPA: HlyD family efflux transporter periplasmic adaptor subunit [Thermoanaerobaculia bacterium]|nr:HlyD family efflux transporter periplasmic adaptor subunit [Thermoanaerobaculia bacterium]